MFYDDHLILEGCQFLKMAVDWCLVVGLPGLGFGQAQL